MVILNVFLHQKNDNNSNSWIKEVRYHTVQKVSHDTLQGWLGAKALWVSNGANRKRQVPKTVDKDLI